MANSLLCHAPLKNEDGYTLIELITVCAIISVLACIALFPLAPIKGRAFDARAKADLRNALNSQEAAFVDNETYIACANSAACEAALPGYVVSDGVEVVVTTPSANVIHAEARHPRGSVVWEFDSAIGMIVEQ